MLALLCGGQGRLSTDMFDLTADRGEAQPVFDVAAKLLGRDPRSLVREADDELLLQNRTSQLLAVTAALAAHACIAESLPARIATVGYSVGEMAAWSIAGIWTAETALHLTDSRARAMDAASPGNGRLGYVRGLDRPALESLAQRHQCSIAIVNPDRLFVIGGALPDVMSLCTASLAAGAARADLRIAAHTSHLQEAVTPFQRALELATAPGPGRDRILFAGGDGARVFAAADAVPKLAQQIATQIDWASTLEALSEAGIERILDLGPGHALADMVRPAYPAIRSYALDGFQTIEGARGWIEGG
jgi:[acyl-carrier-protein] S-malonyltransferase